MWVISDVVPAGKTKAEAGVLRIGLPYGFKTAHRRLLLERGSMSTGQSVVGSIWSLRQEPRPLVQRQRLREQWVPGRKPLAGRAARLGQGCDVPELGWGGRRPHGHRLRYVAPCVDRAMDGGCRGTDRCRRLLDAWAAIVKARKQGRADCEDELRQARLEAEQASGELHRMRMRHPEDGHVSKHLSFGRGRLFVLCALFTSIAVTDSDLRQWRRAGPSRAGRSARRE